MNKEPIYSDLSIQRTLKETMNKSYLVRQGFIGLRICVQWIMSLENGSLKTRVH